MKNDPLLQLAAKAVKKQRALQKTRLRQIKKLKRKSGEWLEALKEFESSENILNNL